MPIAVRCASCQARLGVPDSAAGTKVKCPRCAKMVAVPGGEDEFEVVEDAIEVVEEDFEVIEDEPKSKSKPKPAAKKRPRLDEEDDDDDRPRRSAKRRPIVDDDEDERPRPRKGKGKKKPPPKSSNMPLLLGGGVLALLLLGVGGYFLLFKKDKSGEGGGGGSSAAWVKFDAPDGSFSVSMPSAPSPTDVGALAELSGANANEARQAMEMVKSMGLNINSWMSTSGSRRYVITSMALPAELVGQKDMIKSSLEEGQQQQISKTGSLLGQETLTVAGQSTKMSRVKLKNGKSLISGTVIAGKFVLDLTVIDDGELALTDPNFRKFIESLTVNAGAAASPAPDDRGGLRRPGR